MALLKLSNSYLKLPDFFYEKVRPSPCPNPKGILFNQALAHQLGIFNSDQNKDSEFPDQFLQLLSGNQTLAESQPIALAYCGHQYGNFTKLGDGRAHLLGEIQDSQKKMWDVQLKGSGPTSFSRRGDGRAALGPMLREYLISEAMHALNVPTTRSLAVIVTGEKIHRDKEQPGAVLTRIASSHLRVGSFEYAAAFGDTEKLKQLADYAIDRHEPEIKNEENKYQKFLLAVIQKQAKLIALWMKYGFIHGVMNTDNMTISGETIDYGPCAFMDRYKADQVFSSIDRQGRYRYIQQPAIAKWNLACFANAMLPLFSQDKQKAIEHAGESLEKFDDLFQEEYVIQMKNKLGLFNKNNLDQKLIQNLFEKMEELGADFTNTFLSLSGVEVTAPWVSHPRFQEWVNQWEKRIDEEGKSKDEVQNLMRNHNPLIVPRNYLVEEALADAEVGDMKKFENLLEAVRNPYILKQTYTRFQEIPRENNNYKTFCGT